MKATLLACTLMFLAVFFNPAIAQTDTSIIVPKLFSLPNTAVYDLGRMTLKKKFTQAYTIHAADLEKMPFTDLKEALLLYINGIYGQQQKFAYVIDGVLNTDVNAYSIYDIDEITVVQNAAVALNGVLPSQVLVLIKTKRGGPRRKGITIAGQTNLVRKYTAFSANTSAGTGNAGYSTQDLYQQYYVSAYTNTQNFKAGVSADFQQNVFPQYWDKTFYTAFKPLATDRFKFNGYMDVKLDANNTISINAGYVPQRDRESLTPIIYAYKTYNSQYIAYGNVVLKTNIAQLFTNNLSLGYQRRKSAFSSEYIYQPTSFLKSNGVDSVATINSLIVKDDLSAQTTLGDFTLNANINATYREATDTAAFTKSQYLATSSSINTTRYLQKQKLFAITPSIAASYADIATLQVGVQKYTYTNMPVFNGTKSPKILPFASLSVDILKPFFVPDSMKKTPTTKLMLYASYASTMSYVADLAGSFVDISYYPLRAAAGRQTIYEPVNPYQTYNQIQGGLSLSFLTEGLSFSYNYSNSKFNTTYYIAGETIAQKDTIRQTTANIIMHRLGITYTLPGKGEFKWTTSLNGTLIKNKDLNTNYTLLQLRVIYPSKNLITTGLESQASYRNFFGGVAARYDFDKGIYQQVASGNGNFTVYTSDARAFKLQNVYLGYRLKPLDMIKYLDVFINARNLTQGQETEGHVPVYDAESKRFIGVGIKLGL
ncbi:MAG: hypothetical protein JWQ34_65 [Mucilaginibacter sp.]|uniref:hypothetical protein n=1 Tax=Mucilaginibacter sp. TaxID=1882438 RepID=UPI002621F21A|nr:hypothetical protein [Mucilaginibacter sp.]MDB5001840.1 hypothetical protein [Mucilaginibacter sp.]